MFQVTVKKYWLYVSSEGIFFSGCSEYYAGKKIVHIINILRFYIPPVIYIIIHYYIIINIFTKVIFHKTIFAYIEPTPLTDLRFLY